MIDEYEPWHYVRLNETSRYPRRIVCLDSESSKNLDKETERHSFMLAVASFDLIDKETMKPKRTEWVETDEPEALWEWILGRTKARERTIVFAHNLGYDLRICQALTILPSTGWRMKFISLDSRRAFARFAKGDATITFADSFSFFPKSLDTIGQELGLYKVELPDYGDAPDKWFDRCKQDVTILRSAILQLLNWLERNDCGNFKPTGPAQSWQTFRHKHLRARSLLVHRNREALEAERRAAWTGRTEVWRHGEYHCPLEEYDYRLAYATIAAEEAIPARFLGSNIVRRNLSERDLRNSKGTLYNVTITTKQPLIPTTANGRILWPTGTFETTLWDKEALLAVENGATIYAENCYRYKLSPLLKEWGEWIINLLTNENADITPLMRIMLKHWARAMIGRFAMRYPDWKPAGWSDDSDLSHFSCFDLDGGQTTEWLQLANDWYCCNGKLDGNDTLPAVMSYIMALQRIKLWEAIQAAGELEVFYCDTDSIIVSSHAARNLDLLRQRRGHSNLIRKSAYRSAIFYGPRALVLDDEPRIAGLPRNARQSTARTYKATAWQSLADSLRAGETSTVRVHARNFTVSANTARREYLANGHTRPYVVGANR